MKSYIADITPKHRTSIAMNAAKAKDNFPVIFEADNKEQVKEMAQAILTDIGEYPQCYKINIEQGN